MNRRRQPGRPRLCPDSTLVIVATMRAQGASLRDISDRLNEMGLPTPAGRPRWWHSNVDLLLHTRHGRAMLHRIMNESGQH